jgi:peroxiredoxin Q/BCP
VQAYRDRYAEIVGRNAQLVGISTDSVETQKRFKEQYELPFPLLSDAGGKVAKKYGGTIAVLGLASRATFVVGTDGRVQHIVEGSEAIDPSGTIQACSLPKKG